jgi:predicted transcriptional regulator
MSELGEKADRILELLSKQNTLTVEDLKEKISLEDNSLLVFMHQAGLIELKKEDVRITGFGYEIITAE